MPVLTYDETHPSNASEELCPMCGGGAPPGASTHTDAQVLLMISLMLEDDLVGTVALLLRVCRRHTLQSISYRLGAPRPTSRQAIQLRKAQLAIKYPGVAGIIQGGTANGSGNK